MLCIAAPYCRKSLCNLHSSCLTSASLASHFTTEQKNSVGASVSRQITLSDLRVELVCRTTSDSRGPSSVEGQGGSQPVSHTAGLTRALFTVTAIRGPFGALIAFLLAFRHFLHYGARQRDTTTFDWTLLLLPLSASRNLGQFKCCADGTALYL